MAFQLVTSNFSRYTCDSADTKLTTGINVNSICLELDTGKEHVFDGTAWNPIVVSTLAVGSQSLKSGTINVSSPGTSVRLPNIPCRKIVISARRSNGGLIYAGDSTTSATSYGATLAAKEEISLEIANANLVYIDADNAGEGISYIAI